MNTLTEILRATILSLKQISDRLKAIVRELGIFSGELDNIEDRVSLTAHQETLTQGIADIREDISNIDLDTSDLAKQGSNAEATNTAIYAHIGDVGEVLEYISGGSVDEVIDSYTADYAEEITLMIGDWGDSSSNDDSSGE